MKNGTNPRVVSGPEATGQLLACPKCGSTSKTHVGPFTTFCEYLTSSESWKGYEIRKLKTFNGRNGEGFNADLYKDGKRIAEVMNDGGGGSTCFYWIDPRPEVGGHEAEFLAVAKKAFPNREFEWMDLLVDNMVDALTTKKTLDRVSKKKTLFQVGSEIGGDTWQTIAVPFNIGIKAALLLRHGDQPIFIYGHGNISRAKGL